MNILPERKQKRIAVINDFSGFGRCSLTVAIPIISAAGIECCAVPTAIFSNHTGYREFYFDDYTDKMKSYFMQWKKLGLSFDGIYTGFLGSDRQIDIVTEFIRMFALPETLIITDPVMGDNGRTYATLTDGICRHIGRLAALADIITPNLTEACILTGYPYNSDICDTADLIEICSRLRNKGSRNIVLTGICCGNDMCNFIYRSDNSYSMISHPKTGGQRAGTGDVFASVLAADAVRGISLEESVRAAGEFTGKAIQLSEDLNIPPEEGVCFELLLSELFRKNV